MRWLVIALLAVEGCDNRTCTCRAGTVCDSDGTCQIPACQLYEYLAAPSPALASPAEAWVVGYGPTALYWNGVEWASIFPTRIPYSEEYARVWASAANDVWAVGPGLWHWDGARWSLTSWDGISFGAVDVWGDASDNLYAVGSSTVTGVLGELRPAGTILRWDGDTWSIAYRVSLEDLTQGHPEQYLGISGSSANNIWVLGTWRFTYLMQHWDGAGWSLLFPPSGIYWPSRPWGTSANDAWFTEGPLLYHWDGSSWSTLPAGPGCLTISVDCNISALWGSAAHDVWAVGAAGKILHWDGTAWSTVRSGTTRDLAAVRGASATDIWAVGDCGTILHWNGDTWSQVPSGTILPLRDVWVGTAK